MTSTWKIELIPVPVTDVARAKAFYQRIGFHADHDHQVHDGLRFVQLTPPGSACSIVIGDGITSKVPGTQEIQVVVADVRAARRQLLDVGGRGSRDPGEDLAVVRIQILGRPPVRGGDLLAADEQVPDVRHRGTSACSQCEHTFVWTWGRR